MDDKQMKPYELVADLGALVQAPQDSIVSRTILKDEQVKVVLFAFAPGQELSEHTASTAAIIHVLQGTATLTLGSETVEASAGTWVRLRPQLPHSLYAHTPVLMLLLLLQ